MKEVPKATMAITIMAVLLMGGICQARIKLSALPHRERVEIRLDNSRYTLVEEERIIPLLKSTISRGNNMVDFSWSNTRINKSSIQFRPLAIKEGDEFRPIEDVKTQEGRDLREVSVINVSFPPGENALVWEVYAHESCAVKVRVSYLVEKLSRSFSYRAVADKDETSLVLRNFLKVRNHSGEEFGKAGIWAGFGDKFEKTISRQMDIKMLLHRFAKVPVKKTYTFDWYEHGALNQDKPFQSRVLMHYRLMNTRDNNLGLYPLPPGKVRIFIQDGKGGEAFLGEDWARLTPLDSEMKLYLGEARDVKCERTIEMNERHHRRGNLYDQEMIIAYRIQNFKDKEVTLGIVEQMNRIAQEYFGSTHGDVEWEIERKTSRGIELKREEGGARPVLYVDLPPSPGDGEGVEEVEIKFHFRIKNLWS